jgi:hypothetical protein
VGHAYLTIQAEIGHQAEATYQPSELYKIFLGEGESRALGLSQDQTQLIRRLDKLTRDIVSAWLARALDGRPTREQWEEQTPRKMQDRLSEDGRTLRISLILRSEALALEGVLDPEQGMGSKRYLWSRSGLKLADADMGGSREIIALLDPEVAAAIGLSKSQREDVAARIDDLKILSQSLNNQVAEGIVEGGDAYILGRLTQLQYTAARDALTSAARVQIRQAEGAVWEVLRPQQLRAFRRLVTNPTGQKEKAPVRGPKRRDAARRGAEDV